jgi:Fe-S cluster biogenesis protein NfuA/nitrite reductase/ring-hydroxylating ferredoxin subunit
MDSLSPANARDETLANLAGDVARLETTIETWAEEPRGTVRAYRQAIDALHAEALRRLVRTLRASAGATTALRAAVADEVVYAMLRHHGILKPSIAERVEAALETVRPLLAGHGGNVELVRVDPPAAEIRLIGACDSCPASTLTIDAAIRTALQAACPEITEIVQAKDASCVRSAILPHGTEGAWFPAGMIADLPEGGIHGITLGGRAVILGRSGTRVTCFDDACVHLGAALSGGIAREGILTCPWHGFRYDLLTGACQSAPGLALRAHETMVVGLRVLVRLAA